jgi:hypothetical protein
MIASVNRCTQDPIVGSEGHAPFGWIGLLVRSRKNHTLQRRELIPVGR